MLRTSKKAVALLVTTSLIMGPGLSVGAQQAAGSFRSPFCRPVEFFQQQALGPNLTGAQFGWYLNVVIRVAVISFLRNRSFKQSRADALAAVRQTRAYNEKWAETQALTQAPPVFKEKNPQMAIDLMSGHIEETGKDSDFSPEFAAGLRHLRAELIEDFPFLESTLMPVGRMHITLFAILHKSFDFLDHSSPAVRAAAYRAVIDTWKKYGPIKVIFRGLNLMPNGDLIIEGHIQSTALEDLRKELLAKIQPLNPDVRVPGLFAHITLARSAAPTWTDFVRLRRRVAKNRQRALGSVTIRRPILYAFSDYSGRTIHEAARAEVAPFNQELLEGPASPCVTDADMTYREKGIRLTLTEFHINRSNYLIRFLSRIRPHDPRLEPYQKEIAEDKANNFRMALVHHIPAEQLAKSVPYQKLKSELVKSKAALAGKLDFMAEQDFHFTIMGGLERRDPSIEGWRSRIAAITARRRPIHMKTRGLWLAKDIGARVFFKNYPARDEMPGSNQISTIKTALGGQDDKLYATAIFQLNENVTQAEADQLEAIRARYENTVFFDYDAGELQLMAVTDSLCSDKRILARFPLGQTPTSPIDNFMKDQLGSSGAAPTTHWFSSDAAIGALVAAGALFGIVKWVLAFHHLSTPALLTGISLVASSIIIGAIQLPFGPDKKLDYQRAIDLLRHTAATSPYYSIETAYVHRDLLKLVSQESWSDQTQPVWEALLGENVKLQFNEKQETLKTLAKLPNLEKPVLYAKYMDLLRHTAATSPYYSIETAYVHRDLLKLISQEPWSDQTQPVWEALLGENVKLQFNEKQETLKTLAKLPNLEKPVLYAKYMDLLRHTAATSPYYSIETAYVHRDLLKLISQEPWSDQTQPVWEALLGENVKLQFNEKQETLKTLAKLPNLEKPVLYAKYMDLLRHTAATSPYYSIETAYVHRDLLKLISQEPWSDQTRPIWEILIGRGCALKANDITSALDALSGGKLSELGLSDMIRQWLDDQPIAAPLVGEPEVYELFRNLSDPATHGRFTNLLESLSDKEVCQTLVAAHEARPKKDQADRGWNPESLVILAFWQAGIALTVNLLEQYLNAPKNRRPELLQEWGELLHRFEEEQLLFDQSNPLHIELGYTLLLRQYNSAKSLKGGVTDKLGYAGYRNLLAKGDLSKSDLDEIYNSELWCLALEARQVENYVAALQGVTKGRKVMFVANRSYGEVAVSPLGRRLRRLASRLVSTKIGSTESHSNPYVFRASLFTDEELEYIAKNRPVIVVADGSTSVNDPSRSLAHYPDAYQGYQTQIMALHLLFGGSERDTIEQFGTTPEFLQNVVASRGFQKLRDRIKDLGLDTIHWESGRGGLAFWTPSHVPLQIRQRKKGLGYDKVPRPLRPQDWKGEDMVFLQTAMETEAVHHLAASGNAAAAYVLRQIPEGFRHQAAYFDDTRHFLQFHFRIGPYGPTYSRLFADVAQSMYREMLEAEGLPADISTPEFPYQLVLADYDGTLGRTQRPLHGSMASLLVNILAQSQETHLTVITGQNSHQLIKNLIEPLRAAMTVRKDLPPDLLSRLHISTAFGNADFDITENGELVETFNAMKEIVNPVEQTRLESLALGYLSGMAKARLENHDAVLAIEDLPRQERDIHQKRLQQLIDQAHFLIDVIPVGRHGLRVVPRGMTKADARDRMLRRFPKVPPASVLTLGNNYSGSRVADNFIVVPGGRNVSVSKERIQLPGIEHVGHEERGAYELLSALSNSGLTTIQPAEPRPTAMYEMASSWGVWGWFGISLPNAVLNVAPLGEAIVTLGGFLFTAAWFLSTSWDGSAWSPIIRAGIFSQVFASILHMTGMLGRNRLTGEWIKVSIIGKGERRSLIWWVGMLFSQFAGRGLVFYAPFYLSVGLYLYTQSLYVLPLVALSGFWAWRSHHALNPTFRPGDHWRTRSDPSQASA